MSSALTTTAAGAILDVTIFQHIANVLRDNTTTFLNLVIVLIIFGTEAVFRFTTFDCPCKASQNVAYGTLFIVVPALSLWVLGILANNTTWQLVTGCWRRIPESKHGLRKSSYCCCGVLARATVAPVAWIFFAFLDGKYYECAMSTDPCSEDPVVKRANKELLSKSQIIGWAWLLGLLFVALIGLLGWRSCNRLTHQQDKYVAIYRKMERMEIERQFEEHAQAAARENVKLFLDKEVRSKRDWDEISKVPLLTPRYDGNKEPAYTPLQKFVVKESVPDGQKQNINQMGITVETQTSVDGQLVDILYCDTLSPNNGHNATTSSGYAETKA